MVDFLRYGDEGFAADISEPPASHSDPDRPLLLPPGRPGEEEDEGARFIPLHKWLLTPRGLCTDAGH